VEHFARRRDQLLVASWGAGDKWPSLCDFLAKPVPSEEFPHKLAWSQEEFGYVRTVLTELGLRK
jgi:hypothetical protein